MSANKIIIIPYLIDWRLNSHVATGMATAIMPIHHVNASQSEFPIGVPTSQERKASMTWVRGWFSAKARRAGGIVSDGTNALLTNVSGNMTIKPVHCAASMLLTSRPIMADIQDIASEKRIASTNTKTQSTDSATG